MIQREGLERALPKTHTTGNQSVYMHLYITINTKNGKVYGGKTLLQGNKYEQYCGSGKIIKKAFQKYGIENFTKRTLKLKIRNKDHLNKLERRLVYHLKYRFKNNCYNLHEGGSGGDLCKHMINREWVNKRISEGKKKQYANGQTQAQQQGRKKQSKSLKQFITQQKQKHLKYQYNRGKALSKRIKEKGLTHKEKNRNIQTGKINSRIITYRITQPDHVSFIDTSTIGEFIKKYQLETTIISQARKQNNQFLFKRRTSRTKHPFPENTIITILNEERCLL